MAVRRACSSVSFGERRLAVFIKAGYDLTLPHHEDRRCRPGQQGGRCVDGGNTFTAPFNSRLSWLEISPFLHLIP